MRLQQMFGDSWRNFSASKLDQVIAVLEGLEALVSKE